MIDTTPRIPYNFTPRDYQLPLFNAMDNGKKRAFLRWHRRSGKDKACFAYMAAQMQQRVGAYYYVFPTYTQGKKSFWEMRDNDGFRVIEHFPTELVKSINNQEMKLEAKNGSVMRVIGSDDVDSLRGANPVGIVLSEYADQTPEAWSTLSPILGLNGGWAIFNSTPMGRNHFYHLEQAVKRSDTDIWYLSVLQGLWPDKPHYNKHMSDTLPQAIQEERNMGAEEQFIKQEYGVSYNAGVKGAYYIDQLDKASSEGRIGHYPHNDLLLVDTFWDLGKTDGTAVWFRQLDGDRIKWIKYYEAAGVDIAHYVDVLVSTGYRFRTHYLPHDAEQSRLGMQYTTAELFRQALREAGISDDVEIPHDATGRIIRPRVQDGINAVRSRFSKYYFDEEECFDGIEKLENYHRKWDAKKQCFMQTPVHDKNSHCADALRMEAVVEEIAEPLYDFRRGSIVIDPRDYDIFN